MGNQIIISISREYGSEGHTIAKQIAKDLGLPFYDRNMLDRCSETSLKEYDSLVSIFVTGNKDRKLKHVMEKFSLSKTAATAKITKHDAYRRRYHNHYSDFKWGDSRNYDVCINSSRIGVEGTAKLLKKFVESVKES